MALLTRRMLVCECCALLIANGDDSGCRDHYGHDHPECDLGLGRWESAYVEPCDEGCSNEDHSHGIRYFDYAGCGQGPFMDEPHNVAALLDRVE